MKVAFVTTLAERKLDVPESWPVPRIGEAVTFCDDGETRSVLDVLYAYPNHSPIVVIIRLSEESRQCSKLTKN